MTPWLRRLIGPGRIRDAAPTQPLDDTPAAAHRCWLPQEALDAAERDAVQAGRWERWLARCVIAAVAAFVLFVAWGGGGA